MDSASDLRVLLGSAYPLILAEVRDEARFLDLLRAQAVAAGLPLWTWSGTAGLARDGMDPQYNTQSLRHALAFVGDLTAPGVFVFADAHPALADPLTVRAVKESAQKADPGQTIVLTAPHHTVPPELEEIAVAWSLRPPSDGELDSLVGRALQGLGSSPIEPAARASLVASLRGLTLAAADRIVQQAILRDGVLDSTDVDFVRAERFSKLGAEGALELVVSEPRSLNDVGGLDGLKEWLRLRGTAVTSDRARALGLDPPRGILLTGIPGCGKSLAAKTIATSWGLPLLLLDPGRLYRKYVGESEQRLERALEVAEAMAPAVLWIDEIEKGFAAGGDGDGGVSTRVLGTFLRWLQDRAAGVFVVATANDVSALPPELLRKGRFDEVFFVDLPEAAARRDILRGQLSSRGHDAESFDLDKLVEVTDGFSGADLEAVVVGALYRAFGSDTDPTTEELIAEIEATVPLSRARPEDVARLRAWADGRTVRA
jgi:hypothetical protein